MTINLEENTAISFRTTEPVWIGADGKAYGDDDKPDGSFQLAGKDGVITAEDAEKYGLGKGAKKAPEPKADEAPAERKAVTAAPQNKARVMGHTK